MARVDPCVCLSVWKETAGLILARLQASSIGRIWCDLRHWPPSVRVKTKPPAACLLSTSQIAVCLPPPNDVPGLSSLRCGNGENAGVAIEICNVQGRSSEYRHPVTRNDSDEFISSSFKNKFTPITFPPARFKRDNVANGRGAERRPIGHQPPALFQERAASICGLDLVGDRMRQGLLPYLLREWGIVRRPIAETGTEAMNGFAALHCLHHVGQRVTLHRPAGSRRSKDKFRITRLTSENFERGGGEGNGVILVGLHSSGGDRPCFLVDIDLAPSGTQHLSRAGGAKYEKFERPCRRTGTGAQPAHKARNGVVGHGLMMSHLVAVL